MQTRQSVARAAARGTPAAAPAAPVPQPPSAQSPTSSPGSALLLGFTCTLMWTLCSSYTILANKRLYSLGFGYPMMVTGLGQMCSAAGGVLVARCRGEALQPATWALTRQLAPVVLATAGRGGAATVSAGLKFHWW